MKTRTTALAAIAALAIPAGAQAAKPAEPGKQGRDNSSEKRTAAQQKAADRRAAKQKRSKGVAFVVKGTGLTSLPVADGALTGPLVLDPTAANKHARTLLTLSTRDVEGTTLTQEFGVTGDEVVVKYVGLTADDALQATDVVKVIGKVARTGKGRNKTLGALDIRRITITREPVEETNEESGGETQS